MRTRHNPKKSRNHNPKRAEAKSRASPDKTRQTATIIGLRIWIYGPWITSFLGGSNGAGVPSPYSVNRETVFQHNPAPTVTNNIPAKDLILLKLYGKLSSTPPGREHQTRNAGMTPITFIGKIRNALTEERENFMGPLSFNKPTYPLWRLTVIKYHQHYKTNGDNGWKPNHEFKHNPLPAGSERKNKTLAKLVFTMGFSQYRLSLDTFSLFLFHIIYCWANSRCRMNPATEYEFFDPTK